MEHESRSTSAATQDQAHEEFNRHEILKHMRAHQNHPFVANQNVCMFIGKTGHGKSTTMNWLLGEPIVVAKREVEKGAFKKKVTVLSCPTQRPGLSIGFQPYRSETFFLQSVQLAEDFFACDSPGLGDTSGINVAIAHAAAMTTHLHKCKSVRIVLVLSVKLLASGGDKGVAFRQLLAEMREFVNIENDDYMPLVIYTHLDDDMQVDDVGCSLGELQEELKDPQDSKFLFQCMEDLKKYGDDLLIRPHKTGPEKLREILMNYPKVERPRDVFRCPLSPNLQKQLQLACRQIKEAVQNDLDSLKFKGISQSLDEMRLLSEYTDIGQLIQTYKETVQIVVDHFRRKLEAAYRAFDDKAFSDTATHLDAINEKLLEHMQEQENKKAESMDTDDAENREENAASIAQSYSNLIDLINQRAEEWRITAENVRESSMAHLGQRLGWLQGVCVSLSGYLLENNQTLFKNSVSATITFINFLNSRAIYLLDKNLVSSAHMLEEKGDGAKPLSLVQTFDLLREVPYVKDFVDMALVHYYDQRSLGLRLMLAARSENLSHSLKSLQEQEREMIAVETQVKHFGALLRFGHTITTEFSVHLPESAGLYEDYKAKLVECASESERKIAGRQRNYWAIALELQKLEVVSRVVEFNRFTDRLLEEYKKLEALAQELQESVNRGRFDNLKPRVDMLVQACFVMSAYLQRAWQLLSDQEAQKPQAVEVQTPTTAGDEPKTGVIDVEKSVSEILATLERRNIEALNVAMLYSTTKSESLKSLDDNLKQLDSMWELKEHIPNLETNYTKLETSFRLMFQGLDKSCFADSDPKGQFQAEATLQNLNTVQGFLEVLQPQQGPRFGAPCAGFAQTLEMAKGKMLTNIVEKLANLEQESQSCFTVLLDRTEKVEFVEISSVLKSFTDVVEGIVAISTHLDNAVEQKASKVYAEVLRNLDRAVSKAHAKFLEFLSDKLDAAEAVRNFFQEMKVLQPYCLRISDLCEEMNNKIKAKKTDFAQCRISELDQRNYRDFVVAMQGGRAMERGGNEDRKQWAQAKAALKTAFSVAHTQSGTLMRKLLSKRGHVGHEDASLLLTSISHILLLDESKDGSNDTKGLAEFIPEANQWVQEVSRHGGKLESELNKRFESALEQRDFVQAELTSADLDLLCETAETLRFPFVFSTTSTTEQRETKFHEQVNALDSDISKLVKFGFTRPAALTIHIGTENKTQESSTEKKPQKGKPKKGPPPSPVSKVESEEPSPCTSLCKCNQCTFEASVDPLALDALFEQLKKAKEKDLQLDDFSRIWQTQTRVLDQRIQALVSAARTLARAGQIKAAEECVRAAGEIRQSSHVKNHCTFTEDKLTQLTREVQEAGFNHQLSSFKYWAAVASKANQEFDDLRWKDFGQFDKLKKEIGDQLVSKAKSVDDWVREIKLDDNFTNGQIVPQLSDCFIVRDRLAPYGLPPQLDLDPVADRLEVLLEKYLQQAQNCRKKNDNIHNLGAFKWVLSRFTQELLLSSVARLHKLGERFDPLVKKLIEEVDDVMKLTMQGWDLVEAYDFKTYDMVVNTKLTAYLNSLQKNSVLLSTMDDDSKDISFTRAEAMMKTKMTELDNKSLWSDLVQFCSCPRTDPPVLKLVLANLKDLMKVPEIGTEKVRQEKLNCMKGYYDSMSRDLEIRYAACVKESGDVQTHMMKELNRAREEASAVGKQLTEFTQVTSSDDMVVKTLKKLADEARQNYMSLKPPSDTDLADYVVECYRIGLNVSMPQVKSYVHDLVKEALAQARKRDVDFDELAENLDNNYEEGMGSDVVQDFDDFKAFRLAAFNQKTSGKTFEIAIEELATAGGISPEQRKKLEDAWALYSTKYLEFGINSKLINSRVTSIFKQIKQGKEDVNLIVEALAGICACMALEFAAGLENDPDEIKKVRRNPHPIQILGLFRLLRIDAPASLSSWVFQKIQNYLGNATSDSHLIQIGTGEGKSIALGVLSIFLALLGYEVDCVCYSEVLSKRDYDEFVGLFTTFGVQKDISYGTFRDLSRKVFNEQGDVREGTKKLLSQTLHGGDITCRSPRPRILLIDEVDVFFSRDFYGAVYYPAATLQGPEVTAALTHIWENKGADMRSIAKSQPYKALMQKFCAANSQREQIIQDILHMELSKMALATTTFQSSPHRIENGKVGIVEHGTTRYDLRDGYNTTCWYFHAMDQMLITREEFDKHISLTPQCGAFSYAEIPKGYQRILGMSGTLDCLGAYEREIVARYGIKEQTIMPSLYGKRDDSFDEGAHYEMKLDDYFRKIAQEAKTYSHDAELATLIFFETNARLKQFMDSPYFPRDKDTNVVWTGDVLAHYVTNATKSRRITCFPRVFGRGTDFKCRDKKVIPKGVRVIQTFLSEDVSEEIQIKGRTCRQGDKGSYKMILLLDDLLQWNTLKAGQNQKDAAAAQPLVTLGELQAEHKEGLAKFLGAKRDAWFNSQSQKRIEDVKLAEVSHQATAAFQKDLVAANLESALKYVKSRNSRVSTGGLHLVFCLDRSGSMGGSWKDLLAAYDKFLEELEKAAPTSLVSVILFNETSQTAGSQMTIGQARKLTLQSPGGGTAFAPPLQAAFSTFQASPLNPCFVFMTDGDNGSENITHTLNQLATVKELQSHLVYFGSDPKHAANVTHMANVLQGAFHHSTDLKAVFQTVAAAVVSQLAHV